MLTATQIAAIIMLLQAFGVDAQTIAVVRADLEPTAPTMIPSPVAITPTPTVSSYSSYAPVSIAQYVANPPDYLGKQVVITGMVNALMPRTGNSGSTNYIQIINPFDPAQPKVQLEIDDNSTYSAAANSFQDKSSPILQFMQTYGTAVSSQAFTMTTLFGSQTVMLPVVNVTRIDKCLHGSMNTTILTGSSFSDNFTCTAWTTIVGQ